MIDSIEGCTDAKVCARVAAISNETNGMLDDFEKAVAHLVPVCPVAAKVGKKRNSVRISGIDGSVMSKKGPKTGVEVRYYTSKEYSKLSKEEMAELKDLRPAKKGKGKQKGNQWRGNQGNPVSTKAWKKRIKGQVAAALKQQKRDDQDATDIEEIRGLLSGAQSAADATASSAAATASSAAAKLNAILKKRRGT